MNPPSAAHDIAPKLPDYGALALLDAWRRITRRQIVWTAIVGVLVAPLMLTVTHAFEMFMAVSWSERLDLIVEFLGFAQLEAFTFLLCIVAADHAVQRGAHRVKAYGLALFMGAALYTAFQWSILNYVMDWFSRPGVDPGWVPVQAASTFLFALLLGASPPLPTPTGSAPAIRLHGCMRPGWHALGPRATSCKRGCRRCRPASTRSSCSKPWHAPGASTTPVPNAANRRWTISLPFFASRCQRGWQRRPRLRARSTCHAAMSPLLPTAAKGRLRLAVDRNEEWTRTPFPRTAPAAARRTRGQVQPDGAVRPEFDRHSDYHWRRQAATRGFSRRSGLRRRFRKRCHK